MNKVGKWAWLPEQTPAELHGLLTVLGEIFPLERGGKAGKTLRFERIAGEGLISEVELNAAGALIRYNTVSAAGRGVGSALAGIAGREETPFTMLGIMLDLSRNMVFTVPALKKLFQRLALLGYNTVFLYCEDTYELPGEPFFGYMRGRYTAEEIRTADDIAHELGIELIGCIQTLGHMAQVLRWTGSYHQIRDTGSVMMVDEAKTAELVGKMLDFWGANLRSRRIHVGMDETHDLGRGRYMDIHGYVPGFELFNRQLNMVNEACQSRGLNPIIWSDMYFRLGNPNQAYYDLNSVIPAEVKAAIPRDVQLVYWDYYCVDQDFYEKFIEMHRDLGFNPLMGAGIWIWSRLWYDHGHSMAANRACLNACRRKNLRELFFTMWGDDGAICHFDSAWTGLVAASDMAFGFEDEERSARRYQALTGADYRLNLVPDLFNRKFHNGSHVTGMATLWDDPLLGLAWRNLENFGENVADSLLADYRAIMDKLADHRGENGGGNLNYAWTVAHLLYLKLKLRQDLVAAYGGRDQAALARLKDVAVPEVLAAYDEFRILFRAQWLANAKTFGLEALQHRMAGGRERLVELGRRLGEYLDGSAATIPELDAESGKTPQRMVLYCDAAHASAII